MNFNFRDIKVYKKAKRLADQFEQLSMGWPAHEKFELGSQLRRASSSIALNIAESKQFYVGNELSRISSSYGSASEVRAILDFMLTRKYIDDKQYKNFDDELMQIQKMLYVLRKRLIQNNDKNNK